MKLLILGGTRFVGRHIVEAALAQGHEITLFHRGQSNPGLFSTVEAIHGDRDGGLSALGNRNWDAVIDTCGYYPRIVRQSAEHLRDHVGRYCFISTISVYADDQTLVPVPETGKLIRFDKTPEAEEMTNESYGGFKVLCEDVVDEVYGDRALHVRPGLVIGPWDTSDRFTYWVDRFQRGGDVLVPDSDQPCQFIDGRDLAAFTVKAVEDGLSGAFTANGPDKELSFQDTIEICRYETGGKGRSIMVSEKFLLDQGVQPWSDLPLWVPQTEDAGLTPVDISKGLAHGLTIRPLAETVRDLAAWHAARNLDSLKAGITRERERELLAIWGNQ